MRGCNDITYHTIVHENMKEVFHGFQYAAPGCADSHRRQRDDLPEQAVDLQHPDPSS